MQLSDTLTTWKPVTYFCSFSKIKIIPAIDKDHLLFLQKLHFLNLLFSPGLLYRLLNAEFSAFDQ